MRAADADLVKSVPALQEKYGLFLIPRVPKKLASARVDDRLNVAADAAAVRTVADAADCGESSRCPTVAFRSWPIEEVRLAKNRTSALVDKEDAALKESQEKALKAAKDAARMAAVQVLQQKGMDRCEAQELLTSIVLPSPEKAVADEPSHAKPGPLSPQTRFNQNELLVKRSAGVATSASSRHGLSKQPSVEALAPKALHFRSSQSRLRRSNSHIRAAAARSGVQHVAAAGQDAEEDAICSDHSDVADDRDGSDDDDNSGDDDDDNNQNLAHSSHADGRPAKQAAQMAIKVATKITRLKGFKSPKIPQYKSKKPATRRWDPVIRKYHYFSKAASLSASDQPQPPPRSHKKASPAAVSAASHPVPAPTVPVPTPATTLAASLTGARSVREKSERLSARTSTVTPKVIQFDDKAGSANSKGVICAAAATSVVAGVTAATAPAVSSVTSKPDKSVGKEKKTAAPSARAVGVMPKIIQFDVVDEEEAIRQHHQADYCAPVITVDAENPVHQQPQQQPQNSSLQPVNALESVRKPSSTSTPHKRSRPCVASPPTPAPMTSPRKRVSMACPASNSFETFEEEFAAIVAAETAADPRAEGKLKAFAEFFMGGVVERAELAKKCVFAFWCLTLLSSSCE